MQLENIDIGKLSISTLNMRHGRRPPDISDILPSVRKRGVLVPLLVRPNGAPDTFEIVAGRRRWFAATTIVQEGGDIDPLPCAILDADDDASALEASLLENTARLDPDEVTQWKTFTRLVTEGRTVEELSQTFGMTELGVRRVLALGNLLPRIRSLYAQDAIDVPTVRCLTLATRAQQTAWLKLVDDPEHSAPTGRLLKAWLFGGQSISTKVALFPLETYGGRIIADLFGEDSYFDDADAFWIAQNEAVAAKRDALLEQGWTGVEVMEIGRYFQSYEYEKTPKSKGGRVFIEVSARGEVTPHEGYLTAKEARKARAGGVDPEASNDAKPARAETTASLQTYIDLHWHAAVRAVLTDHAGVALRLLLAHAIAGSAWWKVEPDPQTTRDPAVAQSLASSPGEARFNAKRRAALALIDAPPDAKRVVGYGARWEMAPVFARLMTLADTDLLAVAAVVMGETLEVGGAMVELVGAYLQPDMATFWSADDAFFDLIRDRQTVNAMLDEVGGKRVADGNLSEKVKTQNAILRDFLTGENNRLKAPSWTPKWLGFPVAGYTGRPFSTLARWDQVRDLVSTLPRLAPETSPVAAQ
jgi:ParB family chromosome partitioning protein